MLFKKMLRDLKDNKGPFFTVFLLTFLAIFLFSGIAAEVAGLEDVSGDLYAKNNMPDFWIYSDNFDNDTIADINDLDGVDSLDKQVVLQSVVDLKDDPELVLHFTDKGSKGSFQVKEGEEFDVDDEDGIWLDIRFADERNLTIGDKIELNFNGFTIEKTIRGVGYSPEYVYQPTTSVVPDHYKEGFAYLSYDALPDNFPLNYNVLLVDVEENSQIEDSDDFTAILDDEIGDDNYSSVVSQLEHPSVKQFNEEIEQHILMSAVFVVFFVFIAVLVLLTTMSRIINTQRTQIGILKALGFSKSKITLHYISYGFYIPLVGGILGLILGPIALPPLFYQTMPLGYTLPIWAPGFRWYFVLVLIAIVLLSVIITFFSVRSIAGENPAETLNLKAPKVGKNNFLESTNLFKHLGFNARWNLRDINRNKLRAIVSVVGVIGCVILSFAALGMNDSMDDFSDWKFHQIDNFQSELTLESNITDSQLDNILDDVNGTEVYEGSIELKANGIKKSGMITVHNKTDLLVATDKNQNPINLSDDGIAITSRMAEILGVEKGDTIKWHLSDEKKWHTSTIDDIYSDPMNQGLTMSPETYESYDLNFTANKIITSEDVENNYTGVGTVNTIENLEDSYNEMTESMSTILVVFFIFAVFLSVVILYNLGVMSYNETERDLATLKVLGFDNKRLRKILILPNIWYGIAGFIIGIVPAYYVTLISMKTSGESFDFPVQIHLSSVLITIILTFFVILIISYLLSRKLKSLDMVESLKANE